MNNYVITFFNKSEKRRISENTVQRSFPEAARAAYLRRNIMGFSWEISSVSKTQKEINLTEETSK